jgi:hypothetical protein
MALLCSSSYLLVHSSQGISIQAGFYYPSIYYSYLRYLPRYLPNNFFFGPLKRDLRLR